MIALPGDHRRHRARIPLSLFRDRTFAAIGFVSTFLLVSSGTSAAVSGWLLLPMSRPHRLLHHLRAGHHPHRALRAVPDLRHADHGGGDAGHDDAERRHPDRGACVFLFVHGAALGTAVFGAICTTRLAEDLTSVAAYADALAPVFRYLLPFVGIAVVLALFLEQVPSSDVVGLVAR